MCTLYGFGAIDEVVRLNFSRWWQWHCRRPLPAGGGKFELWSFKLIHPGLLLLVVLVHCAASFEAMAAAPPTGRIKSARFERNEQPSIMLLSSAHVIISSELIPRSIFMPPKTLGLTTQWQMICQTRALVICVTTINWRTTQGLKKDRSFYIDLNRLTAKWTIVFWHW